MILVFYFPSVIKQAPFKAYRSHSISIPKIIFTPNGKNLIFIGGNDKSV